MTTHMQRIPGAMTIGEAARAWGVSRSTVNKWLAQGRVKAVTGALGRVFITDWDRPPPLQFGELPPEARKAWPIKRRPKPRKARKTARKRRGVARGAARG